MNAQFSGRDRPPRWFGGTKLKRTDAAREKDCGWFLIVQGRRDTYDGRPVEHFIAVVHHQQAYVEYIRADCRATACPWLLQKARPNLVSVVYWDAFQWAISYREYEPAISYHLLIVMSSVLP